jgi:hypothetical protein
MISTQPTSINDAGAITGFYTRQALRVSSVFR